MTWWPELPPIWFVQSLAAGALVVVGLLALATFALGIPGRFSDLAAALLSVIAGQAWYRLAARRGQEELAAKKAEVAA